MVLSLFQSCTVGVASSIKSDLQNLKRLVSMINILPPGLFIDQIMKVAEVELTEECKLTPADGLCHGMPVTTI